MGAGQFFVIVIQIKCKSFSEREIGGGNQLFDNLKKKKGIGLCVIKHWLLKGWIIGFMLQIQLLLIERSYVKLILIWTLANVSLEVT